MPKVTVGITCYNAENSLAAAIQSGLDQTHQDIEVLVVDDCSTDGSAAVADGMAQKHPNVRVIRHAANKGVAGARNTVIENAAGDYIAFFDDDDTSDTSRVEKQLVALQNAEARYATPLIICHTARMQVFPGGHTSYCATQVGEPAPRGLPVALRILLGKPLPRTKHGAMATCSQMARVTTYRAMNGFDAALRRSEDTDFNIRLALAGGVFVGIAEPLVTQTMTLGAEKRWDDEHGFTLHVLSKYDDVVRRAGFAGFAPAWATMKLAFLKGDTAGFIRQGAQIALKYPWQTLQRASWVLPNVLDNVKIGRFRRGLNCL